MIHKWVSVVCVHKTLLIHQIVTWRNMSLLLITFSHLKMDKQFLAHEPYKNWQLAGFRLQASVCWPLDKRIHSANQIQSGRNAQWFTVELWKQVVSHGLIEKYWNSQIVYGRSFSRCVFPSPKNIWCTIFRYVFFFASFHTLYIQILTSSVLCIPKHMLLRNIRQILMFFLHLRIILIRMKMKL